MIPDNNEMRFEVTTRCNYNCIICPREQLTRKIETMSLDLFKKIFDKIFSETGRYNSLAFPGMGEPLMDETLGEKISYAKKIKNNMPVLILTNGSLLTPEKFKEFEELGVASIRVSLYGNDPESYSKVHGVKNKGAFEKIKKNLEEILRIKNKTELILTFNVVKDSNDGVMDSWIKFWENKADLIEVWRPHNWVEAKKYRKTQAEKLKTCGRPFNGPLQIQVDGTVNMCCFDFNGELTLGDLKKQTLNEIFSSPLYNKIVACHQTGNFSGSKLICENCDQRNIDKSDVMVYNSKFDIKERVNKLSTTYIDIK